MLNTKYEKAMELASEALTEKAWQKFGDDEWQAIGAYCSEKVLQGFCEDWAVKNGLITWAEIEALEY